MKERVAQFGPGQALLGIETSSAQIDSQRPTWIFLNAGIVHRVGPHRLTVNLARRLAQAGFQVLRFDLSGLGDSSSRSGITSKQAMLQDVRDAMDHLERTTQTHSFVLCGLCSGADNSVRAALFDSRIVGIALLDPYVYRTAGFYIRRCLRQMRSASSWKTLARQLVNKLGKRQDRPTQLAYVRPTPERSEFAADLHTILGRGAHVLVIYSNQEDYNYAEQFDEAFGPYGLRGRVSTEFLPESNHTHTEIAQQRRLGDVLVAWAARRFPTSFAAAEHQVEAAG